MKKNNKILFTAILGLVLLIVGCAAEAMFSEVENEIALTEQVVFGNIYGMVAFDMDGDSDKELYVANGRIYTKDPDAMYVLNDKGENSSAWAEFTNRPSSKIDDVEEKYWYVQVIRLAVGSVGGSEKLFALTVEENTEDEDDAGTYHLYMWNGTDAATGSWLELTAADGTFDVSASTATTAAVTKSSYTVKDVLISDGENSYIILSYSDSDDATDDDILSGVYQISNVTVTGSGDTATATASFTLITANNASKDTRGCARITSGSNQGTYFHTTPYVAASADGTTLYAMSAVESSLKYTTDPALAFESWENPHVTTVKPLSFAYYSYTSTDTETSVTTTENKLLMGSAGGIYEISINETGVPREEVAAKMGSNHGTTIASHEVHYISTLCGASGQPGYGAVYAGILDDDKSANSGLWAYYPERNQWNCE